MYTKNILYLRTQLDRPTTFLGVDLELESDLGNQSRKSVISMFVI